MDSVYTPDSLVDRYIAEGLDDARAGRTHGPHSSAEEAAAALERRAERETKKRHV